MPKLCQPLVIEPVHHGSSSILLVHFLGHTVCSPHQRKFVLFDEVLPKWIPWYILRAEFQSIRYQLSTSQPDSGKESLVMMFIS